jgi:hypothetical protein
LNLWPVPVLINAGSVRWTGATPKEQNQKPAQMLMWCGTVLCPLWRVGLRGQCLYVLSGSLQGDFQQPPTWLQVYSYGSWLIEPSEQGARAMAEFLQLESIECVCSPCRRGWWREKERVRLLAYLGTQAVLWGGKFPLQPTDFRASSNVDLPTGSKGQLVPVTWSKVGWSVTSVPLGYRSWASCSEAYLALIPCSSLSLWWI